MKKTTLLALLMVTLLPIASYLFVSNLSKDAIKMPRRYFYDTVVVKMEKGKKVNDTVWHKVRPFKLKNQFGKEVGLEDWGGKIIIADFFFTCLSAILFICSLSVAEDFLYTLRLRSGCVIYLFSNLFSISFILSFNLGKFLKST